MRYRKKVMRRVIRTGGRVLTHLDKTEKGGKRVVMNTGSDLLRNLGQLETDSKHVVKMRTKKIITRIAE